MSARKILISAVLAVSLSTAGVHAHITTGPHSHHSGGSTSSDDGTDLGVVLGLLAVVGLVFVLTRMSGAQTQEPTVSSKGVTFGGVTVSTKGVTFERKNSPTLQRNPKSSDDWLNGRIPDRYTRDKGRILMDF